MQEPRWAYILVYDEECGTYEDVRNFLNTRPEVLNWYRCLPHSFIIVSNKTATELKNMFKLFASKKGRFLIADLDTDRNGWLPSKAWELINEPKGVSD